MITRSIKYSFGTIKMEDKDEEDYEGSVDHPGVFDAAGNNVRLQKKSRFKQNRFYS
jgi:hypothetical protein